LGTGQDGGSEASLASGLAQVDCGSAPVSDEVIVLWVLVSVTSRVSKRWAVMSQQAPAWTLARGRAEKTGRGEKGSSVFVSTPGIVADLNRKWFDISISQL